MQDTLSHFPGSMERSRRARFFGASVVKTKQPEATGFRASAIRRGRLLQVAVPWIFLASLSCFFLSASAFAAELRWESLPDRERVTILMRQSEGFPGTVGRIAPTGVVVPFTEVPAGLAVEKAPQGAKLFKGTQQQGRALVLLTQTPEFGFLVSRQTQQELTVDFFSNPLGARWKPTSKAPTTEKAPDEGISGIALPDAANVALNVDPQGKSAVSEALKAQSAKPVNRQALSQRPPSREGKNPVVVLSGSPTHALSTTRQADPPSDVPVQASVPAERAIPKSSIPLVRGPANADEDGLPDEQGNPPVPLWNTGAQTSGRSAPLPVPPPPLGSAANAAGRQPEPVSRPANAEPVFRQEITPFGSVPTQTSPAQTSPAKTIPAQSPGTYAGVITPSGATVGSGTASPVRPEQRQAASGASSSREADRAAPAPVSPGVGVRVGAVTYGGLINPQGVGESTVPAGTRADQEDRGASGNPNNFADSDPDSDGTAVLAADPAGSGRDAFPGQATVAPGRTERDGQAVAAVPMAAASGPEAAQEAGQVPPPNPEEVLPAIAEMIKKGEFAQALAATESLLDLPDLTQEQREKALHIKAEMLYAMFKDDFAGHYLDISDATTKALNFNPKSPLNAGALLRLGYMNLRLNNLPEAEARFNLLRRLYPEDENVPLTYYYWGEHHFGRNELQKAADEFQLILQKYANSRYAREAALGLARSLYKLGYYDQAFTVVDYIERRWERFYLDFPPFLNMMGDVAFRLNKLDVALRHYWLYINLEPEGEEADIILTRIGDIYSAKREKEAAKELYGESIRRFPDKDGALVARMRLAEEGINDDPSIAGMYSIFDGPFSLQPLEVYKSIINDHPASALVPLAKIKLAMWHLWKRDYIAALDDVTEFMDKHPKDPLMPKAREVALQAFAMLSADGVSEERYAHMREIWENYPIVHMQAAELSPESRIALGVTYWKEGKPNEALQAIGPFFLGEKIPEYSEMALSLALSLYLEYEQWQAIEEVANRVDLWEIKPETQKQLDYALALASENMGQSDKAVPIWQKLYESSLLSDSEKAYASFFLARHAEKERNLEKAYTFGRESLNRLLVQVERDPGQGDLTKIKSQLGSLMDVAETAGRLREALGFAEQYLQYLDSGDVERMAVRYRMARIYRKQGDQERWKTILTDLSSGNPNSVYGRIASSELNSASLAQDAAKYSPTGRL